MTAYFRALISRPASISFLCFLVKLQGPSIVLPVRLHSRSPGFPFLLLYLVQSCSGFFPIASLRFYFIYVSVGFIIIVSFL